jgi:hypothetical protein
MFAFCLEWVPMYNYALLYKTRNLIYQYVIIIYTGLQDLMFLVQLKREVS